MGSPLLAVRLGYSPSCIPSPLSSPVLSFRLLSAIRREDLSGTGNLAFRYPRQNPRDSPKYFVVGYRVLLLYSLSPPHNLLLSLYHKRNRQDGVVHPVTFWQWQKRRHLRRRPSPKLMPACRPPAVVDPPRRPRFENGWLRTRSVCCCPSDDDPLNLSNLFTSEE